MQGKGEPSKQDLTKQLAANWNVLSRKDKKVREFSHDSKRF